MDTFVRIDLILRKKIRYYLSQKVVHDLGDLCWDTEKDPTVEWTMEKFAFIKTLAYRYKNPKKGEVYT